MKVTSPVSFRFSGNAAKRYAGIARTKLGVLKNILIQPGINFMKKYVKLDDDVKAYVVHNSGQDFIDIRSAEDYPPDTTPYTSIKPMYGMYFRPAAEESFFGWGQPFYSSAQYYMGTPQSPTTVDSLEGQSDNAIWHYQYANGFHWSGKTRLGYDPVTEKWTTARNIDSRYESGFKVFDNGDEWYITIVEDPDNRYYDFEGASGGVSNWSAIDLVVNGVQTKYILPISTTFGTVGVWVCNYEGVTFLVHMDVYWMHLCRASVSSDPTTGIRQLTVSPNCDVISIEVPNALPTRLAGLNDDYTASLDSQGYSVLLNFKQSILSRRFIAYMPNIVQDALATIDFDGWKVATAEFDYVGTTVYDQAEDQYHDTIDNPLSFYGYYWSTGDVILTDLGRTRTYIDTTYIPILDLHEYSSVADGDVEERSYPLEGHFVDDVPMLTKLEFQGECFYVATPTGGEGLARTYIAQAGLPSHDWAVVPTHPYYYAYLEYGWPYSGQMWLYGTELPSQKWLDVAFSGYYVQEKVKLDAQLQVINLSSGSMVFEESMKLVDWYRNQDKAFISWADWMQSAFWGNEGEVDILVFTDLGNYFTSYYSYTKPYKEPSRWPNRCPNLNESHYYESTACLLRAGGWDTTIFAQCMTHLNNRNYFEQDDVCWDMIYWKYLKGGTSLGHPATAYFTDHSLDEANGGNNTEEEIHITTRQFGGACYHTALPLLSASVYEITSGAIEDDIPPNFELHIDYPLPRSYGSKTKELSVSLPSLSHDSNYQTLTGSEVLSYYYGNSSIPQNPSTLINYAVLRMWDSVTLNADSGTNRSSWFPGLASKLGEWDIQGRFMFNFNYHSKMNVYALNIKTPRIPTDPPVDNSQLDYVIHYDHTTYSNDPELLSKLWLNSKSKPNFSPSYSGAGESNITLR